MASKQPIIDNSDDDEDEEDLSPYIDPNLLDQGGSQSNIPSQSNTPPPANSGTQSLKDLLLKLAQNAQNKNDNIQTPSYQGMNAASNLSNYQALQNPANQAAINQSGAQLGTLNGKVADTSAVTNLAANMQQNRAFLPQQDALQQANIDKNTGLNRGVLQYLQAQQQQKDLLDQKNKFTASQSALDRDFKGKQNELDRLNAMGVAGLSNPLIRKKLETQAEFNYRYNNIYDNLDKLDQIIDKYDAINLPFTEGRTAKEAILTNIGIDSAKAGDPNNAAMLGEVRLQLDNGLNIAGTKAKAHAAVEMARQQLEQRKNNLLQANGLDSSMGPPPRPPKVPPPLVPVTPPDEAPTSKNLFQLMSPIPPQGSNQQQAPATPPTPQGADANLQRSPVPFKPDLSQNQNPLGGGGVSNTSSPVNFPKNPKSGQEVMIPRYNQSGHMTHIENYIFNNNRWELRGVDMMDAMTITPGEGE